MLRLRTQVGDAALKPLGPPIDHPWWRELIRGDFTSVIYDCTYDLDELVSSRNVSQIIRGLGENRKEILYYRVVWQWSPQRIAACCGQTDHNTRKVYDVTIRKIRKELYERLRHRYENDMPRTEEQLVFVRGYIDPLKISDASVFEIHRYAFLACCASILDSRMENVHDVHIFKCDAATRNGS